MSKLLKGLQHAFEGEDFPTLLLLCQELKEYLPPGVVMTHN